MWLDRFPEWESRTCEKNMPSRRWGGAFYHQKFKTFFFLLQCVCCHSTKSRVHTFVSSHIGVCPFRGCLAECGAVMYVCVCVCVCMYVVVVVVRWTSKQRERERRFKTMRTFQVEKTHHCMSRMYQAVHSRHVSFVRVCLACMYTVCWGEWALKPASQHKTRIPTPRHV